jgi:hypothetical protein
MRRTRLQHGSGSVTDVRATSLGDMSSATAVAIGDVGICLHRSAHRGVNIPRAWGSFASEVCDECGAFRALTHHGEVRSEWRPAIEYADAVSMEADE